MNLAPVDDASGNSQPTADINQESNGSGAQHGGSDVSGTSDDIAGEEESGMTSEETQDNPASADSNDSNSQANAGVTAVNAGESGGGALNLQWLTLGTVLALLRQRTLTKNFLTQVCR